MKDWFSGNGEAKLDGIRLTHSDGDVYTLAASGVDALVQAMAGFTQPASLASIDTAVVGEQDNAWQLAAAPV